MSWSAEVRVYSDGPSPSVLQEFQNISRGPSGDKAVAALREALAEARSGEVTKFTVTAMTAHDLREKVAKMLEHGL